MRITPSISYRHFFADLSATESRLHQANLQASSGYRIVSLAEDPAGAARALALRSDLRKVSQALQTAATARPYLQAADAALTSLESLLVTAETKAIQGASDTSANGRSAIALEIDGLLAQAQSLANTVLSGEYLFSGTATDAPPFDASGVYQGTGFVRNVALGDGSTVAVTVRGDAAFQGAVDIFTTLSDLATALRNGDVAAIRAAATDLGLARQNVDLVRSGLGADLNAIQDAEQLLRQREVNLLSDVSSIEDVDLARALVDVNLLNAQQTAILGLGAQLAGPSLLDFLV